MQNKFLLFRAVILTVAVAPLGCISADPATAEAETPPVTVAPPPAKHAAAPAPERPKPPAEAPELLTPEAKEMQKELAKLRLEKSVIDARLALADAKRKEADDAMSAEKAKLDAERALRTARLAAESASLDEEKAKLDRETALETAKANQKLAEKLARIRELETDAKIFKTELETAIGKYTSDLALFQKQQEARKVAVNAEPQLLKEPLVDGTLFISNRRIPFNGVVTQQLAETVIERINFFNNQSTEYPIFIVIDNSPGGSVAAGFQILKAMESSKAPVYVVVKGFAASMAAVTTTLAEKSFCYNNTIMLHHQMSTGFRGNMTYLKEQLDTAEDWYKRLATPVAKKMGITLEEFTKQMYAHTSTGDWQEFGDKAQELKWVDTVVERMVETEILDTRDATPKPPQVRPMAGLGCVEKVDENGKTYFQLPILDNPYDAWWISDKRGLYRAQ
ncbi:MAG: ATP-dependent Clp protease proteolytic subunit [Puniceicoccales bacterium]|nr:ATP-dependent Clp protease proteolytic subunit [Puniceicoccales bacterium]